MKKYYPTITDLKNKDCFDFTKWEWEEEGSRGYGVWVVVSCPNDIDMACLNGETYRYSLKEQKPKITHVEILTVDDAHKKTCSGLYKTFSKIFDEVYINIANMIKKGGYTIELRNYDIGKTNIIKTYFQELGYHVKISQQEGFWIWISWSKTKCPPEVSG